MRFGGGLGGGLYGLRFLDADAFHIAGLVIALFPRHRVIGFRRGDARLVLLFMPIPERES